MLVAKEGLREIFIATLFLGALTAIFLWLFWPIAIPFTLVWIWVISFFRDPPRHIKLRPNELGSPADGRITEITKLEHDPTIGGPAIRIGMFLSIFNVHLNRAACAGRVRSIEYQPGEFLDARHPESGIRNESNKLVIDSEPPIPGPIVIRQVSGKVARHIICRVSEGHFMQAGEQFGLIKFGSRTELIVPDVEEIEVVIKIGERVNAGITVLARVRS